MQRTGFRRLAIPSTVSLGVACIYLACIALICRGVIRSRRELEAALRSSSSGAGGRGTGADGDAFLWKYADSSASLEEASSVGGAAGGSAAAANVSQPPLIVLERLAGWPKVFPEDLDAYREGVLNQTGWGSDDLKYRAEIAPWVWHHRGRADVLRAQLLSDSSGERQAALEEAAARGIAVDADVRASASFVVLIRNRELDDFLRTMRQLEARFNRRYHYPYLFLNDEPFTDEFMHLIAASTTSNVTFALIPRDHWSMPASIDPRLAQEARDRMEANHVVYGKSLSYRHMCRFNSGFFYKHPLLRDLDWYWRVEPGVDFYCDIDYDPFRFMQDQGKVYSFVIVLKELQETIPTLWQHTLDYMAAANISSDWMSYFVARDGDYNLCHMWSNFEIASLGWLRSAAYEAYFQFLDQAKGFFMERWGDAPVHSIAAGMLLNHSQIHFFDDIGYRHDGFARCPDRDATVQTQLKCQCPPDLDNFDSSPGSCLPQWKAFRPSPWTPRDTAEARRLVADRHWYGADLEPRIAAEARRWYGQFGSTW